MSKSRIPLVVLLAVLPAMTAWSQADQGGDATAEPGEVTIGPVGSTQDPLSGRDTGLAVEPDAAPSDGSVDRESQEVPALRLKVDPRVLGVAPGEPLPPLRREGETLRKRDGRLLATGDRGYAVFILDADPVAGDEQALAMFVAPCMALESMERMIETRGENLRFTITGEVHTYRGANYLLPTSQPKPWLIDEQVQEKPAEVPEQGGASDSGDESEAEVDGQETSTPAAGDGGQATPSADDVLQQLLDQRRDSPASLGQETEDVAPPAAGPPPSGLVSDPLLLGLETGQPQAELKDEGQFLLARTGRLVQSADGSHALFVLDSDGPGVPEPPMIIQACKLLETMEQTVFEQGENVPFVITGQVFTYRGANYLLPTIVKREFDRGNLE